MAVCQCKPSSSKYSTGFQSSYDWTNKPLHQTSVFKTPFIQLYISFLCQMQWSNIIPKNHLSESVWILLELWLHVCPWGGSMYIWIVFLILFKIHLGFITSLPITPSQNTICTLLTSQPAWAVSTSSHWSIHLTWVAYGLLQWKE